jgi:hypothetical protein
MFSFAGYPPVDVTLEKRWTPTSKYFVPAEDNKLNKRWTLMLMKYFGPAEDNELDKRWVPISGFAF